VLVRGVPKLADGTFHKLACKMPYNWGKSRRKEMAAADILNNAYKAQLFL
jgi:hypothetical protein